MPWTHRIIKKTEMREYLENSITTYGVHQVYIDENGDISRIEDNPMPIFDESVDKLKDTIEKIQDCLKKPVIDYVTGKEIQ
jgi:hypothetical protein